MRRDKQWQISEEITQKKFESTPLNFYDDGQETFCDLVNTFLRAPGVKEVVNCCFDLVEYMLGEGERTFMPDE